MKRFLLFLVALLFCGGTLAGCGVKGRPMRHYRNCEIVEIVRREEPGDESNLLPMLIVRIPDAEGINPDCRVGVPVSEKLEVRLLDASGNPLRLEDFAVGQLVDVYTEPDGVFSPASAESGVDIGGTLPAIKVQQVAP